MCFSLELCCDGPRFTSIQEDGCDKGCDKVNGQKLETVTSFKYLGSVINDEASKPEILSRIAQATAALTRLKPVWNDWSNYLSSKI